MSIEECYERLGGDYAEVFSRFRREALIQKFALKFLNDTSFDELSKTLEAGETLEAFRAAHTLKGVCANLSFKRLADSASTITEMLRVEKLEEARGYFATVREDYMATVAALKDFSVE